MDWSIVWKAALALTGVSLLFGVLLAIASVKFHVEMDPRVDRVLDALVGSNCGACGYPGCQAAAEAVVAGKADVDVCLAGGKDVAEAVADVMGVEVKVKEPGVALVHCKGGLQESAYKAIYQGIDCCTAADHVAGGGKACEFGCLGLGTCKRICPVNAIVIDEDHRRWVNRDKCTGCGLCVEVCPRNLIEVVPRDQQVLVMCSNKNKGKKAREVCSVSCIACKKCEKACQYDAIKVVDNCARIDYDKCTQCGDCIEACPNDVIVRVVPTGKSREDKKERKEAAEKDLSPTGP